MDTAVGAEACPSGDQVWNGNNAPKTPKPTKTKKKKTKTDWFTVCFLHSFNKKANKNKKNNESEGSAGPGRAELGKGSGDRVPLEGRLRICRGRPHDVNLGR